MVFRPIGASAVRCRERRGGGLVLMAVLLAVGLGCGGQSADGQIRDALVRYSVAQLHGDFRGACSELSASLRRQFAIAARASSPSVSACATILRQSFASLDAATLRRLRARAARVGVAVVQINGDRARLRVSDSLGGLTESSDAAAIREHGAWRISELPGHAKVGSDLVFRVPSASMEPTLKTGSTILVDPIAYSHRRPAIGDLVAVHPPENLQGCVDPTEGTLGPAGSRVCGVAQPRQSSTATFLKRIVAGPGDLIALRQGRIVRNGQLESEPYIRSCGAAGSGCDFPQPVQIPSCCYFVLGDNRGESDDSRFWGPVRTSWIVGKVLRTVG